MSDLSKKVQNAIKVIKMAEAAATAKTGGGGDNQLVTGIDVSNAVECSYSTGKDSDVLLRLCQMADIKHIPIYKHTGIDPAGSLQHARENNAVVIKPQKSFFKLIEDGGFPTRRARFCCQHLKEYKVLDVSVQGIRKSESRARAERYKEPQICRMYNKKDHVQVFLPLLDWTDADVKEFIESENIKCHRHYYDEDGNFHVERRVGCLCCVLQSSNKLKADFKAHPQMVKAFIRHGKIWWNSHPNARSHVKFTCIEDLFFHNVFCNSYQDYVYKTTGMFGRLDTKAFLEDYFKISLP